jgi:hypothetical protein
LARPLFHFSPRPRLNGTGIEFRGSTFCLGQPGIVKGTHPTLIKCRDKGGRKFQLLVLWKGKGTLQKLVCGMRHDEFSLLQV